MNHATPKRIVIQNGFFCGREEVRIQVALKMIEDGLALPADAVWSEVDGYPTFTFTKMNLTFKAYDKIVNAPQMPAAPGKEKLHAQYSAPVCIPATQKEEVYRGSRKQHSDGPVTGVVTVLRKIPKDGVGFENWDESETFRPGRRNEDHLPWPIFTSEFEMRTYLAKQNSTGQSGSN